MAELLSPRESKSEAMAALTEDVMAQCLRHVTHTQDRHAVLAASKSMRAALLHGMRKVTLKVDFREASSQAVQAKLCLATQHSKNLHVNLCDSKRSEGGAPMQSCTTVIRGLPTVHMHGLSELTLTDMHVSGCVPSAVVLTCNRLKALHLQRCCLTCPTPADLHNTRDCLITHLSLLEVRFDDRPQGSALPQQQGGYLPPALITQREQESAHADSLLTSQLQALPCLGSLALGRLSHTQEARYTVLMDAVAAQLTALSFWQARLPFQPLRHLKAAVSRCTALQRLTVNGSDQHMLGAVMLAPQVHEQPWCSTLTQLTHLHLPHSTLTHQEFALLLQQFNQLVFVHVGSARLHGCDFSAAACCWSELQLGAATPTDITHLPLRHLTAPLKLNALMLGDGDEQACQLAAQHVAQHGRGRVECGLETAGGDKRFIITTKPWTQICPHQLALCLSACAGLVPQDADVYVLSAQVVTRDLLTTLSRVLPACVPSLVLSGCTAAPDTWAQLPHCLPGVKRLVLPPAAGSARV